MDLDVTLEGRFVRCIGNVLFLHGTQCSGYSVKGTLDTIEQIIEKSRGKFVVCLYVA